MGWCEGSELAEKLWKKIKPIVPEEKRKNVARAIFTTFQEDTDADTMEEAENLLKACAYTREDMSKKFGWDNMDDDDDLVARDIVKR